MSTKPIALITGANKGIGLEIARQLGEKNYVVWIGSRDGERGEKAAADLRGQGIDAHALLLDVTSVQAAAGRLGEATEKLDVLINNAGISIGGFEPASETDVEAMRAMFEVNTFGPVRVTKAFLPLLRKAKGARIVMVSSGLGSIAATVDMAHYIYNVGYTGYSASKSALNMYTVKLAKELMAEGIKVNAIDPGYTATDLNNHMGHRTVEEAAVIAVRVATRENLAPTGGFFFDGKEVEARHPW